MARRTDLILTALAPAIWGSTYIVTTELLPDGYPMMVAMLRALPAGLLLLVVTRSLPCGIWLARSFLLGALNFSVFWWLLFVAAYRLPGGVAATVGAVQPLVVLYLSKLLLDQGIRPAAVIAGIGGLLGVGLLVLTPGAALDWVGLLAALGGAISMAFGTVLTRRWQPPVPALTFTAWQLTAGGLLLLPVAFLVEPALPPLDTAAVFGFVWLGLIGGAATYFLWFRGIARLDPATVAPLGLLSPVAATLLGLAILGQTLSAVQTAGMLLVLASVWFAQRAQLHAAAPVATRA
ncbi:EamA family transporter [Ponticoccus sp. (in: a-proteobacteria)]|uniref:EamA family transporter n=1 Tax=Ponticoccus sp. (in: a-proteobacteria) TaxID=1925025 RepID=UPI003AB54C9E